MHCALVDLSPCAFCVFMSFRILMILSEALYIFVLDNLDLQNMCCVYVSTWWNLSAYGPIKIKGEKGKS